MVAVHRWSCCLFMMAAVAIEPPPREMPAHLFDAYTQNGTIEVGSFFVDDTNKGKGTHYKYMNADMVAMVGGFAKQLAGWAEYKASEFPDEPLPLAEALATPKQHWPLVGIAELGAARISGAAVVVFGSMEPWTEAICLALGARHVTTVEYNQLTYEHDAVTTLTVDEFRDKVADGERWDVAMSFSSFDHDGLGRYGDPLDPDGDMKAMREMMGCLKPAGGAAILTVPIGPDVVVWNLHRRYGELRLPRLLEGWKVVGRFGWDEARLTQPANWRQTYEPVFLLEVEGGAYERGATTEAAGEL